MKKAVVKEIHAIAAELPQTTTTKIKSELGAILIHQGITNINGEEIDPKFFYEMEIKQKMDHVQGLKDAYSRNNARWKGVAEYVSHIKTLAIKQYGLVKKS